MSLFCLQEKQIKFCLNKILLQIFDWPIKFRYDLFIYLIIYNKHSKGDLWLKFFKNFGLKKQKTMKNILALDGKKPFKTGKNVNTRQGCGGKIKFSKKSLKFLKIFWKNCWQFISSCGSISMLTIKEAAEAVGQQEPWQLHNSKISNISLRVICKRKFVMKMSNTSICIFQFLSVIFKIFR